MKRIIGGLIPCLFEILVGILLLVRPVGFTSGIIIAAGIVSLVVGLYNVVKYFRTDAETAAMGQLLVKGLVALLGGIFCIANTNWLIATFPALTIIYGVVILITGFGKVQKTVDLIRAKNRRWFLGAISAIISIVCAVVILNNPFTSTAVLWMFTGITLIIEAVFDAVACIATGIKVKGEE